MGSAAVEEPWDMSRPDYSEYVAHFTSSNELEQETSLSALEPLERLANILSERRIRATHKWWGLGGASVAFTECPWTSLLDHAARYSPYGVGFEKARLWGMGGGPAIYVRSDVLRAVRDHVNEKAGKPVYPAIPPDLGTFYTPYEPEPGWEMLNGNTDTTRIDFAHEREWRVPGDVPFEYADVRFLIIETFADVDALPVEAVEAIGTSSILSMSNYKRIEELWPTH